MTIRVRTYRRGGYEVDIRFTWPDGAPFRVRVRSPVSGRSASQRWGEAREMVLLRAGQPAVASPYNKKEVPTLAEFWPRFIDGPQNGKHLSKATVRGGSIVDLSFVGQTFRCGFGTPPSVADLTHRGMTPRLVGKKICLPARGCIRGRKMFFVQSECLGCVTLKRKDLRAQNWFQLQPA